MKKLGKLTLKELGNSCLLVEPDEANSLKGGTSPEDFYVAVDAGTWTGGDVDGMGYCLGTVTCSSGGSIAGNSNSSSVTYYSGTDQWQSTMNVPSGSNYQPDIAGSAINHGNDQPSMAPGDRNETPFGEYAIRKLYEWFGSN